MSFKDRTFCASPNCTNKCGRKMSEELRIELAMLSDAGYWEASERVWYAYFCGKPEQNDKE